MKEQTSKFLITGGNFTNKGAQAMLFVAIDQIKKRCPDAEIFVLPIDNIEKYDSNLAFTALNNHPDIYKLNGKVSRLVFLFGKNILRFLAGKNTYIFKDLIEYSKIMKSIKCVIDISGFCLSSQFANSYNMGLIRNIREAKKYGVPMVLMPQSFGPFDYIKEKKAMLENISSVIDYPKIIFAREIESAEALEQVFGVRNVMLSTDMVLQNKGVDLSNIYHKVPDVKEYSVENNSVAVVPNSMTFSQASKNEVLNYYNAVIKTLISNNKHVYIVSHSEMDRVLCEELYRSCFNQKEVNLVSDELMCYEFDRFVRQMDFIVASRYHSVVHAYKNCVPCVVLGWAVKYQSLAKLLGQEKLIFDVRNTSGDDLKNAIDDVCRNFKEYSEVIKNRIGKIQEENCFCYLDSIIK